MVGGIRLYAPTVLVTTRLDELDPVGTTGTGESLREALRDVDVGGTILFDISVFNSSNAAANTIALTTGQLTMDKSFNIDASNLTQPLIIQASNSRHLAAYTTRIVSLKNITFTGGKGTSPAASQQGGAIYNAGNLTVTDCQFIGNSASDYGGAIYSNSFRGPAVLTLIRCTIQGNTTAFNGGGVMNWAEAGNAATLIVEDCSITGNTATNNLYSIGGGIMNYATNGTASLTIRRSTLHGNVSSNGSGIMNYANGASTAGPITLVHTTIAGNSPATGVTGYAGGLRNYASQGTVSLSLANSIIAENFASSWPDIVIDSGTSVSLGGNVIGANDNVIPSLGDHFGSLGSPQPALLAPLGNYGGRTLTRPLLPGSIAKNTGVSLSGAPTTDQRGYPHQGAPDAGAYETDNLHNYAGWSWEKFPAATTTALRAGTADYDGDGISNLDEWLANTVPTSPSSFFRPDITTLASHSMEIRFPSAKPRNYTLQSSDSLTSWTSEQTAAGTGALLSFNLGPAAFQRRFFRVLISN
jgi:predicted outer membrane repeat protein